MLYCYAMLCYAIPHVLRVGTYALSVPVYAMLLSARLDHIMGFFLVGEIILCRDAILICHAMLWTAILRHRFLLCLG